ncbi:MAG: hypothetical protein GX130_00830 [Candidatus Hydrogenedens sp.]|nr:hypothetical protein [Candidatus Hydrogenedens sp.]
MRKHVFLIIVPVLAISGVLYPLDAQAWGPKAMRSITAMSLQVLKNDYPDVFRPGGIVGVNFEKDVVSGSTDGWQVLAKTTPLNSDAEVVEAIASEIQLLREARTYGPTSYFAYRMGVLSSLTAHLMLPYGYAWTAADQDMRRKVVTDIENQVDFFHFKVPKKNRDFVRNASVFFTDRRDTHAQDKKLIAHDYKVGTNYKGYLKLGGQAYFIRAVETVADVWNTVLQHEDTVRAFGLSKPSSRSLAWYFVQEMDYLLNVKDNMTQVEIIYKNFERVGAGMTEAMEQIGDMFYDHPQRTVKLRGVSEWQKAFDMGGKDRTAIGVKLSEHYMSEGNTFLLHAAQPDAEETDLNNAKRSFEDALNYDRSNESAAKLIQETDVAIRERNERLEVVLSIIATGERIHEEANRYREMQDFANAISTYRQSIGFFDAVDEEFKVHANTARESIRRLRREISDLINEVLDAASQAIDEGDRARDNNQFDEASNKYLSVSRIVSVIPEDESASVARDKQEVVELASRKLEESNVQKLRYEQMLQEQAQQAQQAQQQPQR